MITTAVNSELIANKVSSTPGTKVAANMNMTARARQIPPRVILKVLEFLFICGISDVK